VLLLSGVFFFIFLTVSAMLLIGRKSGGSGSSTSTSLFNDGSVAILEINGVILDSKKTLKRIERFEEDDQVRAVVVRINSPGGAVAPSQEIYEALRNLKKPVVASMSSVAASGGYYIACAAQKIFANAGTLTGSIGVIMEFANLEKLYEWVKVKRYSIKTGKFKDSGTDTREMTSEERALLQAMVDDVLAQFKSAVSTGRKLTPAQVTAIADGRIFSGQQAKAVKLVDELGTLQDAINEAGKLAKIKGKPSVIHPDKPKRGFMEFLLNGGSDEDDAGAESRNGTFGAIRSLLQKVDSDLGGLAPGIYWLWSGAR
jgi:protease-4